MPTSPFNPIKTSQDHSLVVDLSEGKVSVPYSLFSTCFELEVSLSSVLEEPALPTPPIGGTKAFWGQQTELGAIATLVEQMVESGITETSR